MNKYSPLILLTTLVSLTTFAQTKDTSKTGVLDEVVVTGQYQPQSVKRSVYQVRVISKERIQKQAATKLQDVLNTELNIRFSQDLATGGSNMSMMGLGGQNVKILLDGVPMVGRQGTSNEINVNQIDINAIERIEIIEGPMSVVYGADALAGVINIITKKPKKEKLAVNARLQEESVGDEYGFDQGIHNQYLGLSGTLKNWQFSGGIGRNLFTGWKDTAVGRELIWHKKDQIVANASVGYHTEKFNIYYRLDGLDEIITNPGNYAGNPPKALDQEYITDRIMQQLQSSYIFNAKLSANVVGSYTHFTRQVYTTTVNQNNDVRLAIGPGLQSISTFDGITVRATAVYKPSAVISFQPGIDINSESGEGERIKTGTQTISDYAFFITSEITAGKKFSVRPGLRFMKNSVYDSPPVIPSINAKYSITDGLDFRLAYAMGFRAPSIRELYYDFHDASHDINGNPDLKAESSNSITGSLAWKAVQKTSLVLTTTLSGFYNDIKDRIDIGQLSPTNPNFTYINIGTYKTRGLALNNNLNYKNLNAALGFSYTFLYNEYEQNKESLPEYTETPEVNATLGYSFPKIGLDFNFYYKFTGKRPYYQLTTNGGQTDFLLVETGSYNWADFTVNKKLFKYFILNAGVKNIFDVTTVNNAGFSGGAHANSGATPIGYGRSYFAGLAFNWAKK